MIPRHLPRVRLRNAYLQQREPPSLRLPERFQFLSRRAQTRRRHGANPRHRERPSHHPPVSSHPPLSLTRSHSLPLRPPPHFSVFDQGRILTREPEVIPQVQDEPTSLPPPVLTPKPSIPPLTPEGRKSIESRRSTDSRHSREERRSSGQYASPAAPAPPPLKKRAPTSLVPEQGVIHEDIGDPIAPRYHTQSPVPHAPPPTSAEPLSSVPPTSAAAPRSVDETEDDDGLKRRKTIAERMAKLGGIKFGAPPPIPRAQPSTSTAPIDEVGTDRGIQSSGQSAPEEPPANWTTALH
ncbi:hypothetical protein BJY52DRAFT_755021 [Lactarius psammicola]|nr:hypothetical protein BJY52DRAFT_755021 [Lactarius psammicola]